MYNVGGDAARAKPRLFSSARVVPRVVYSAYTTVTDNYLILLSFYYVIGSLLTDSAEIKTLF